MAYDPSLADRIRAALDSESDIQERKMFGGLAFLRNGNMATSAYNDGGLMIRCSADDWESYCTEEGARPMLRKGAPVSGWVLISVDVVRDDAALAKWIQRGLAYAAAQPPK
jgi:TfoX/Sxy family transcriptional regulator of competence genes